MSFCIYFGIHKGYRELFFTVGIGILKEIEKFVIARVIVSHHTALKCLFHPCISRDDAWVMALHALKDIVIVSRAMLAKLLV